MSFFRFPRTPHLAWIGDNPPRDDKLLTVAEREALLSQEVTIEEKVDGANVGISLDSQRTLRAQNRGGYLSRSHRHPQFGLLFSWIDGHRDGLVDALGRGLILFGEWCQAVHAVRYTRLPDWFLAFDVYDLGTRKFWSTSRRDQLIDSIGLARVPQLGRGRFDVDGLKRLLEGPSRLGEGPSEGLYLRADVADETLTRAKLVRPGFLQRDEDHWSRRPLVLNELARESE